MLWKRDLGKKGGPRKKGGIPRRVCLESGAFPQHPGHSLPCSVPSVHTGHTNVSGCPRATWPTTASQTGPESLGSPVAGSEKVKPFSPRGPSVCLSGCAHPLAISLFILGLPCWLRWGRICLQCRRPGVDPRVGKIPWRREWQPAAIFLPGESHGQRNLAGYSPWIADTTE